jgi:hypothetical protein
LISVKFTQYNEGSEITEDFFAKEALNVREGQYQAKVIKRLEKLFPGCTVLKADAGYQQGFPDLILLWNKFWAALEVKTSPSASVQPNQDYYINKLNEMSFAAYIYPESEEEVLNALQQAFESPRRTCVSQP